MDPSPPREQSATGRIVGSALAAPVLGALAAIGLALVATVVLSAILFDGGGGASDEGDALGAILIFMLSWAASFVLVTPAIGYLFARHQELEPRSRVALTLLFGLWVPVGVCVGGAAAWFGYRSGLEFVGGAVGVVIAAALIKTAVVLPDSARVRNVWLVAGGAIVIFVVGTIVLEPIHRRSIYSADPPPMGLIDESELDAALPGWRLGDYQDAARDGGWPLARLTVFTSSGAELELTFAPGDSSCSRANTKCDPMVALDDGTVVTIWRDSAECGTPRQSAYVSVDAARPGGHWSVDSKGRCGSPEAPRTGEIHALLNLVRVVTLDEWIDAT